MNYTMTILPSYTSERYYLLSEIEQRATFLFLVEKEQDTPTSTPPSPHAPQSQSSDGTKHDAFYLLWDLRATSVQTVEQFRSDVTQLLVGNHRNLSTAPDRLPSSLLAIEVVVDKKVDGVANNHIDVVRECISENNSWIRDNHRIGCVYVGIADNAAGAPALEAIMDYAIILDNHYTLSVPTSSSETGLPLRVVGTRQGHMLGHDPTRDPDAASDVYQAECIFSAKDHPDDTFIASSIPAWLKSLGIGNGNGICSTTSLGGRSQQKRKKGAGGKHDEGDDVVTVWGMGDSFISLVVISCIVAAVISYFIKDFSLP